MNEKETTTIENKVNKAIAAIRIVKKISSPHPDKITPLYTYNYNEAERIIKALKDEIALTEKALLSRWKTKEQKPFVF